ncbi:MAG TPA: type II secretion system protein [bacterium]|nr:type II secretion system protein [bacterium]
MVRRHGFTLIELMIAIVVSLFVIGTFLRFFSHAVRVEGRSTVKSDITLKGNHILDTVESAIRLAGLGNSSLEFKNGAVILAASGVATNVDGGPLNSPASFTFVSPWGGPVTKVAVIEGETPACRIYPQNNNAFTGDLNAVGTILLVNKANIFTAGYLRESATSIVTQTPFTYPDLSNYPNLLNVDAGLACAEMFPPHATILTGPNRAYTLTYDVTTQKFRFFEAGATADIISMPREEIPFMVLQFLTEAEATGGEGELYTARLWTVAPADFSTIKAVRFGFVMASRLPQDMNAALLTGIQYCMFGVCFTPPNSPDIQHKRYTAFSRVVYLRNIDSLKRHLNE